MTAIDLAMLVASPVQTQASTRASHTMWRVAKFQAQNVARSRWLLAYALFFLSVTEGLLRFGGGGPGAILSLANVMLYVVPLVTLVVGTVYFYNAREFTELLLAQPVSRRALFAGLYGGIAIPLALSLIAGAGVPMLLHARALIPSLAAIVALFVTGCALTLSFAGIALLIALKSDDRLRGMTVAIAVWMLGAIVYDGLVLAVVAAFGDYALERPMLALTLANPIDLARVALLLQLDYSALMGYTGAVFQQFLGGAVGTLVAGGALLTWIVVPAALALRAFRNKDF